MLPRRRFHPDEHLSIGIALNHSHAIACGDMIFIGGQADIDAAAQVSRPDDLVAQTRIAMEKLCAVLNGLDADHADLVKLSAFYLPDDATDEAELLDIIGSFLGDILSYPFLLRSLLDGLPQDLRAGDAPEFG